MAARRLHGLIYTTIAFCCLVIIVCGVALGTNEWFRSEGLPSEGSGSEGLRIEVNYGLFKGKKIKFNPGSSNIYDLRIVCISSEAKCMFSCGQSASSRKEDFKNILDTGKASDSVCQNSNIKAAKDLFQASPNSTSGAAKDPVFLNFGLYIMTIVFLVIAMTFSAVGGGLALYNTYRTPIQPVLSVLGLFIWNAISALAVLLAMIIWGVAFATSLKKNAGISDTLVSSYDSDGNGKLGMSFWILILAVIFSLANIGILKYRSWKIIQMEANHVRVMTEKLDNGDILLF